MQPDKVGHSFRDICHNFFAATSLSIATVVSACGENLGNSSSFDKSKPLTESYQIANALADSGKHREAVIHYKRIISIGAKEDRQWIKVYSALGHSLFKLGLYDAAIKSEDEVIKFFPDDPIPYSNKSWYWHAKGQYWNGVKDASKALELKSKYLKAFNNRALNYLALGLYEKTINDANMAIQLDANQPEPYVNRALAKKNVGQLLAACRDARKARELGDFDIESDLPECF